MYWKNYVFIEFEKGGIFVLYCVDSEQVVDFVQFVVFYFGDANTNAVFVFNVVELTVRCKWLRFDIISIVHRRRISGFGFEGISHWVYGKWHIIRNKIVECL